MTRLEDAKLYDRGDCGYDVPINRADATIFTKNGLPLARKFERKISLDNGDAFLEISPLYMLLGTLKIPKDKKYSDNPSFDYVEYEANNQAKVIFAILPSRIFKIGMYYISTNDVDIKGE